MRGTPRILDFGLAKMTSVGSRQAVTAGSHPPPSDHTPNETVDDLRELLTKPGTRVFALVLLSDPKQCGSKELTRAP